MSEVKISEKRLKELERSAAKLQALENGGVDNWEWYSESLKEWNKENRLEEILEEVVENIHDIMVDGVDWDFPAGREAGISLNLNLQGEEMIKRIFLKLVKDYAENEED
jgi:hypothetical protein